MAIVILAAVSLGVGFASAFVPPVNAELLTMATVAASSLDGALTAVIGVTTGQGIGKIVIYEAVRAGRRRATSRTSDTPTTLLSLLPAWAQRLLSWPRRTFRPAARTEERRRTHPRRTHPRWQALKAWLAKWANRGLALMNTRPRCAGIMAISATIGFPPLLLTTIAAGAANMRRTDFVLIVLLGRLIRFGVVAWPVLALKF